MHVTRVVCVWCRLQLYEDVKCVSSAAALRLSVSAGQRAWLQLCYNGFKWKIFQLTSHINLLGDENRTGAKQSVDHHCWRGRPCKRVGNQTNVGLRISTISSFVNKICPSQSSTLSSRLLWAGISEISCCMRGLAALYWFQEALKFVQKESEKRGHNDVLFEEPETLRQTVWFGGDNKHLGGIFGLCQAHRHSKRRKSETDGHLLGIHLVRHTCECLRGGFRWNSKGRFAFEEKNMLILLTGKNIWKRPRLNINMQHSDAKRGRNHSRTTWAHEWGAAWVHTEHRADSVCVCWAETERDREIMHV